MRKKRRPRRHLWRGLTLTARRQEKTNTPLPPQPERPLTRAECHPDSGTPNAQRPCPWVGCRYHLLINTVNHVGTIKTIRTNLEDDLDKFETCALDVAEDTTGRARGRLLSTHRIAELTGLSHKGVDLVLRVALEKLKKLTNLEEFFQ